MSETQTDKVKSKLMNDKLWKHTHPVHGANELTTQ